MKIKYQDQSNLVCEDDVNSQSYDLYLADFQTDIRKIIGKFRKSYHALSEEDIFSECNYSLIKNKKKILESFQDSEFNQNEFKKIAYHYVKNCVSWSHYGEQNSKDAKNREDSIYNTDDGPKTTFDLVLENEGEEDENFESFDSSQQIHEFFHILKKYSYLLRESQVKILSYMEKGLNQDEIAEKLGVTRQAVSYAFIEMKDLLCSQFNFNKILKPSDGKDVSKGIDSLESFFSRSTPHISDKDKKIIKKLLISEPLQHTADEINSKFLDNRYKNSQISSFCVKNKLYKFLKNKKNRFSKKETDLITELLEKGKTIKYISKKLNFNPRRISGLKGSLVQKGIIAKTLK